MGIILKTTKVPTIHTNRIYFSWVAGLNFNENEQLYRYFSNINFTENIWCKNKVEILEADIRKSLFCFCMISGCVCLCLFSFTGKRLTEQSKSSNGMPKEEMYLYEVPFFCIKDNHIKNLQDSNCAKNCQWNRAKPPKVKDNNYNFLKPTVKARSIATFVLTSLGNRSYSAQGQILSESDTTLRGVTFY